MTTPTATTQAGSQMSPGPRGWPILRATLRQNRIATGLACFYIILIVFVVGLMFPVLRDVNFLALLSTPVGAALVGGASVQSDNLFATFLSIEFYGVWYCLMFGGFLAYIAGGAIARSIEDGSIDFILTRSFSRSRFYMEQWAAVLLIALIMSLWSLLSVYLATVLFEGAQLEWKWVLLTQLVLGAFFVFVAGLGLLISSFVNASRAAGGIVISVLVLAYLMQTLGSLTDRFHWMEQLSPLYYAPSARVLVNHELVWWHPVVLIGLGLVLMLAGLVVFNRRDIAE